MTTIQFWLDGSENCHHAMKTAKEGFSFTAVFVDNEEQVVRSFRGHLGFPLQS